MVFAGVYLRVRGKNQILRIEQSDLYHGGVAVSLYSLRAAVSVTTVFSAKTNKKESEHSMEFIGFYISKCHPGDSIGL